MANILPASALKRRQRQARPRRGFFNFRLSPTSQAILLAIFCIACPFLLIGVAHACDFSYPPDQKPNKPVIGIDLGTTYSCVSTMRNGKVEIIPNELGHRTIPSYVSFDKSGILVGELAKDALQSDPTRTIFDAKRLIGRTYLDKDVQNDIANFPFEVIEKGNGIAIRVDDVLWTPEEISAQVLMKLKETAESYLQEYVEDAVITVPAYFNDAQRAATKRAAQIAGLNVLRLINEPTAASFAYGLDRTPSDEQTILVYDLGGGTFDVSILAAEEGIFEVLATAGATHLGGEDFDQRIVNYLVSKFRSKTKLDITSNDEAMAKLKNAAEVAKIALTTQQMTLIEIDNIHEGYSIGETLTRESFNKLNKDLFKQTITSINQALRDAKMQAKEVDHVVLVGGSTRIPYIRNMLQEYTGKKPLTSLNPDEAVAFGAAVVGCIINDCPGAEKLLMMDINPLTLGIEIEGGVMSDIIKRGTSIPTKRSQTFSTTADDQETVKIKVFEGESPLANENHLLGEFELTGIPPAPRGVPQIDVTFEIDSDSILKVTAMDRGTGKERTVTLTNTARTNQQLADQAKEMFEKSERMKLERFDEFKDFEIFVAQLRQELRLERIKNEIDERSRMEFERQCDRTLEWVWGYGEGSEPGALAAQKMRLRELLDAVLKGGGKKEKRWSWDSFWSHGEL